MTELALAPAPTEARTDAVIVTAFEDGLSDAAAAVDRALEGLLAEMRESREIRGKFAESTVIRTLGRLPARHLLVLGLGRRDQLDSFRLHNAFQFAGKALRGRGVRGVSAYLDRSLVDSVADGAAGSDANAEAIRAVATALLLANFDQGATKTEHDDDHPSIERVHVGGVAAGGDIQRALDEAVVLAEATNQARAWAATPSNLLTPTLFAESAKRLYEGTGLEVEVMRREDLEREGMGALLGVAQGSEEPPVMVVVRYDGGRPDGPRLGLVGKGITFDTGGISIKPANGMERMKYDMSGGAAVLAAMWAIARLGPPVNVVAVVPSTENMPGGRAYKPGDILKSASGKTIEVLNTDAEGRIVLADGLTKARRLGATHIVDAATLTGSVVIALGHVTAGLMSNDRGFTARVEQAARRAGDRVSELPMFPEYDVCLRSDVADMKNVGDRAAGTINGAVFLREFVEDVPWVHLDIAGLGWNDQADMSQIPKGPTGAPVRTLVHLALAFASVEAG
jgi:leucyl aminopeptidase